MNIFKNDVIAIIEPVYIDFPGGKWADHFVDRKKYFKAMETANNAGNFKAKDSKGRLRWIHTKDVSDVVKRG